MLGRGGGSLPEASEGGIVGLTGQMRLERQDTRVPISLYAQ